jgi:hypothetical protein
MKLGTTITFRREKNALCKAITWLWLFFKPEKERKEALKKDETSIELFTRANIIVLTLVFLWAALYFSFQYNFEETPRYFSGPLFTIAPTLFLQEFRHAFLDYFCSYFYVYGMAVLYLIFWCVAMASERNMWKFALGFLICWIAQGTLQLAIGAASPVRVPGNGVDFIRFEVFPLSESTMGIKYGAVPSGHIGAPVILFLTGWLRRMKWVQWAAFGFFITFWFVVLYLGEHYVIDGVVSLIIYPIIFMGAWKLADRFDKWNERKSGDD